MSETYSIKNILDLIRYKTKSQILENNFHNKTCKKKIISEDKERQKEPIEYFISKRKRTDIKIDKNKLEKLVITFLEEKISLNTYDKQISENDNYWNVLKKIFSNNIEIKFEFRKKQEPSFFKIIQNKSPIFECRFNFQYNVNLIKNNSALFLLNYLGFFENNNIQKNYQFEYVQISEKTYKKNFYFLLIPRNNNNFKDFFYYEKIENISLTNHNEAKYKEVDQKINIEDIITDISIISSENGEINQSLDNTIITLHENIKISEHIDTFFDKEIENKKDDVLENNTQFKKKNKLKNQIEENNNFNKGCLLKHCSFLENYEKEENDFKNSSLIINEKKKILNFVNEIKFFLDFQDSNKLKFFFHYYLKNYPIYEKGITQLKNNLKTNDHYFSKFRNLSNKTKKKDNLFIFEKNIFDRNNFKVNKRKLDDYFMIKFQKKIYFYPEQRPENEYDRPQKMVFKISKDPLNEIYSEIEIKGPIKRTFYKYLFLNVVLDYFGID